MMSNLSPQLNQFTEFGRQASQFVVGQIECPQIDEKPDVGWQACQTVVI